MQAAPYRIVLLCLATSEVSYSGSSSYNFGNLVNRVLRRAPGRSISSDINRLPVGEEINFNILQELHRACQDGLQTSYIQFLEENVGRDKEGLWIIPEKFQYIQSLFEDIKLVDEDEGKVHIVDSLLKPSPWPVWVNFTDSAIDGTGSSSMYELALLSVPAGKCQEPRRHPSGTILLYKKLFGDCQMRSIIGSREIKREEITNEMMIRLAGSSKIFESLQGAPAGVLELALYPPRRVDEGFGSESGFCAESKAAVGRIDLSGAPAEGLFESVSLRQKCNDEIAEQQAHQSREGDSNSDSNSSRRPGDATDAISTALRASIGGLNPELRTLIRRVLMSRHLPLNISEALGFSHVRGLLLYGPPGTGKTLIARELGRVLNATETKIVNGPEVLTKYIGESEQNIRALFRDAEEDWEKYGTNSPLHVIVFDELDSIARARGNSMDNSGVRDSCVNQLLSKLDGVRQLNNILVIGLTNRKDLIDPALLRPGRLEVHIEVQLPDLAGRQEILNIYFSPIVKHGFIAAEEAYLWVKELSRRTEGYSGAQLVGLMREAASRAIDRWYYQTDSTAQSNLKYSWEDFEDSLPKSNKMITNVRSLTSVLTLQNLR